MLQARHMSGWVLGITLSLGLLAITVERELTLLISAPPG